MTTGTEEGSRSRSYGATGRRAAQLGNALRRLGVDGDQRVATFMWNNAEHLEAYLAVPSMGAVLHTLNIRSARLDARYPQAGLSLCPASACGRFAGQVGVHHDGGSTSGV